MTTRPWRQEIELLQNYPKHKTFTIETSGTTLKTVVDISAAMEECNKVSFIVETNNAYIAFDENANNGDSGAAVGMLIPANEGYFDDSIYLSDKITVMSVTGNTRVRGIIWGR